ncbi:MAG: hypothetical protein J6B75_02530 [Ruminococcus sp.]|nr:hypothetical protein [Ruminococcus sp.]
MIVLKILMWILLAVLGLILLVLILPVSAKISYIGGKLNYSVKYSFLPMLDSDGGGLLKKFKDRKKKAPEEKEAPDEDMESEEEETSAKSETPTYESETSAEVPEKNETPTTESEEVPENNDTFSEEAEDSAPKKSKKKRSEDEPEEKKSKLESILELWEIADRPALKIFKGIKLSELYIDIIVANEDAYKCALNYGRVSGAIYQLLGWLSVLFNVKLKTVDINPGFALSESRWDASVKISLNLMTPVIAGIWFLIIYIFKIFIPSKTRKKSEVR